MRSYLFEAKECTMAGIGGEGSRGKSDVAGVGEDQSLYCIRECNRFHRENNARRT